MDNFDGADITKYVVIAEGSTALAAERLAQDLGRKVTENKLIEALIEDTTAPTVMGNRFRTLMMVKLFELITVTRTDLMMRLDDLEAKDLARLHTSLMATFVSLTAPAAKDTFDIDTEVRKAADELGVAVEEVANDVKKLMAKAR